MKVSKTIYYFSPYFQSSGREIDMA